jgi:hypothetical protein
MMRNCFVREEGERLVLGSGIAPSWLDEGAAVSFGPAPTAFGTVSVDVAADGTGAQRRVQVSWRGDWHAGAPAIEVCLPGFEPVTAGPGQASVQLQAARAV